MTIQGSIKSPMTGQNEHMVISVCKVADAANRLHAILLTQSGDHRFYIPTTLIKAKSKKDANKPFVKALQEYMPGVTLNVVSSGNAHQEILKVDERRSKESKLHKIAVFYVGKGKTEEDILNPGTSLSLFLSLSLSLDRKSVV